MKTCPVVLLFGWCPFCYENMKGRARHKGHRGYHPPRPFKESPMSFNLRKRSPEAVGGGAPAVPEMCWIFKHCPAIYTMLVAEEYPDGGRRATSTVTFFCEAGVAKVCLNDRDQGLTAWASGVTPGEALEALEKGLDGDSLAWRRSGGKPSGKGKKGA